LPHDRHGRLAIIPALGFTLNRLRTTDKLSCVTRTAERLEITLTYKGNKSGLSSIIQPQLLILANKCEQKRKIWQFIF
jgi:hypothetical protein